MTIKTKSIILVCFLKGFRGNPLYKGENKTGVQLETLSVYGRPL